MLHWRTGQIPLDAKLRIRKDLIEVEALLKQPVEHKFQSVT